MPTWLSQMFFWIMVIVPFLIVYQDKIDTFLDKAIAKIKKRTHKTQAIIKAIILTIKETKNYET